MSDTDPIDRVRDVRRRISEANDNDTQKLLAYCETLQSRYRDGVVRLSEPVSTHAEEAGPIDSAPRRG